MVFQGQTGPLLIGVVSWTFATLQKHNFERKQAELQSISEKIRVLYGPLHGNRVVYKASYAAICKKRDLKDWLKEAQDTKNADMIRQWRKFHLDVLHPLDLAAVRLIKDNSHLYHQNCVPEELFAFIEHVSGNVYQMDCWKNQLGSLESKEQMSPEDYLVENNLIGFDCKKVNSSSYGECGNCEVTQYVIATLTELRERKSAIEEGLTADTSLWGSFAAICAIFANYA